MFSPANTALVILTKTDAQSSQPFLALVYKSPPGAFVAIEDDFSYIGLVEKVTQSGTTITMDILWDKEPRLAAFTIYPMGTRSFKARDLVYARPGAATMNNFPSIGYGIARADMDVELSDANDLAAGVIAYQAKGNTVTYRVVEGTGTTFRLAPPPGLLESIEVDVIKADSTVGGTRLLTSTATAVGHVDDLVTVNLRVAGKRIFFNGSTTGIQAGDVNGMATVASLYTSKMFAESTINSFTRITRHLR